MWLTLLKRAVEATSLGQVARELDLSRTALSLVINGKYPAKADRIALKVMGAYGKVACPYLGMEIIERECRGYRQRACPTSSPREMRHWRACQHCSIGIGLDLRGRFDSEQGRGAAE